MVQQTRQFFMCPPDHFAVDYAINAWTAPGTQVDIDRALDQWELLYNVYLDAAATVGLIEPEPGIPELVFAGDSIFLFGERAVSSRFRHAERQPEVLPMARRFARRGYRLEQLPE